MKNNTLRIVGNARRSLSGFVFLSALAYIGLPPSINAQGPLSVLQAKEAPRGCLLNYEVNARGNYTKAGFRFWSPASNQVEGVIVLVPGSEEDGRDMLDSPDWQALARKYRLAIVSCFLQGYNYPEAKEGTGGALLEALNDFAERSGHGEIARCPLLLYGESAGGQFNYNFTLWRPSRVEAFVVNKGGFYDTEEPTAETCSVPGLFIFGQEDLYFRMEAIRSIWSEGRKRGAVWALAPEPNAGHDFIKTPAIAQQFFAGALERRRLENQTNGEGLGKENTYQGNQGWLGNLTTYDICEESRDHRPLLGYSWFPNEESAKAWKAFVSE